MQSPSDQAKQIAADILKSAAEVRKSGTPEAMAVAVAGILSGKLAKANERIERLEGDIRLLTEMLANVEAQR